MISDEEEKDKDKDKPETDKDSKDCKHDHAQNDSNVQQVEMKTDNENIETIEIIGV